jgi:hypothetical protein
MAGPTTVKVLTATDEIPPAFEETALSDRTPVAKVKLLVVQIPFMSACTTTGPPVDPMPPDTVTLANGVAVPMTIGLAMAVLLFAGLRMATTGGATVVNEIGIAVVPPGPVAVTVSVVGPVGRVASGPQLNVPEADAVVVQSVTGPGPVITIVVPGVAVPVIVGVVVVDVFNGPVTCRLGIPTTVKLLIAGLDRPPAFEAKAVSVCGPATKLKLVVDQIPLPFAATTTGPPVEPGPPVSVTLANGVAVPTTVGLVVAVLPTAGDRIATTGAGCAVKLSGTAVVPPGPVAVTVTVIGPVGTVTGQANVPEAEAVVVQSVTGPGPVITT